MVLLLLDKLHSDEICIFTYIGENSVADTLLQILLILNRKKYFS